MNETQKRIKAYQEALPGLKERVAAVALLLVMSIAMMTSATFAWLTLSQSPEVASVATTVTANGNLEIALSDKDGLQPEESAVGDSASTKGNSVVKANLTWGNLVNLSDPSYGLDHLILRPAMLGDTTDLLNNPLASVNFGQDGRVEEDYNYDLAFTNWNSDDQFFEYSANETLYGVRAISTIEYKIQNATYERYRALVQEANSYNTAARNAYRAIVGSDASAKNNANIKAVAGLMGDYMTAKLNGNALSSLDVTGYVDEIWNMMSDFVGAYALAGDALAKLADVQVFLLKGASFEQYDFDEGDNLWIYDTDGNKTGLDWARINALSVELDSLARYETDTLTLQKDLEIMKDFYNAESGEVNGTVYWTDIENVILDLVDIPTCTVAASATATPVAIKNLGKQAAMDLLGSKPYAVINKGLIVNFEALTGEQINLSGVSVSATYIVTLSMEAASITTASYGKTGTYYVDRDTNCTFDSGGGDTSALLQGSAQDTYGMAIDLWVRTNAADSYLILEGNVLTEESEPIEATLVLSSGEEVSLYSATIKYPEEESGDGASGEDDGLSDLLGNSETVEVYSLTTMDDNDNEVKTWYFADTHGPVYTTVDNGDGTTSQAPTRGESITISSNPKTYTTTTVIGYEGENRVWQENNLLSVNSTTQGAGSCYVFYADNPTDQQNSLKLLSNLRVAFLGSDGSILAMAKLDTANTYADSGKVTIPLVLTGSTNAVYTQDGDLAITLLGQNAATRITMIVYLEGSELTNDQVLAANEIEGKLNVQFGSSAALYTMGDETLQNAERHVSASVSNNAFDYATDTDMTTTVSVQVDGDSPSTVTAFFLRQVNSTQGSREETMTFRDDDGDGVWTADYTFDSPGTYILRSVQLDGQDYDLDNRPTVTVAGLDCTITCNIASAVLTGSRTYTTSAGALQVKINTNDDAKMPKSVQLQFINNATGDPVTALMTYANGTWSGQATFTSSGSYTLTYVIMDGDYTELSDSQKTTFHLTLGVSVRIRDDVDDPTFEYTSDGYTIGLLVDIYNEADTALANLQGVELYYGKQGSTLLDKGLNTDLAWDSQKQCYTGAFLLEDAGIYTFNYVTIASSNITNTTTTPPVYTMISPDPPAFVQNDTAAYQLINTNTAAFEVLLANADSATIKMTLQNTYQKDGVNLSNEEVVVETTVAEEYLDDGTVVQRVKAAIPSDSTYGQDGRWQITRISFTNVYSKSGEEMILHTDDNPLVWDMTDGSVTGLIATHVDTPKLTIHGTTEGLTADVFMTASQNTQDITIALTDAFGDSLDETYVTLGAMTAKYAWTLGSDKGYGTYTFSQGAASVSYPYGAGHAESYLTNDSEGVIKVYSFTNEGGGSYKLAAGTIQLPYAGLYKCTEVNVVLNGKTYHYSTASTINDGNTYNFTAPDYSAQMPVYAYKTGLPVVKVSSVSPASGTYRYYTTAEPSSTDQMITGSYNRKINDYSAVVYTYFATQSGAYDQEVVASKLSSVTLALTGVPADTTGATMVFEHGTDSTYDRTFSFSGSNGTLTATSSIGGATDGSYTNIIVSIRIDTYPVIYPAGKQTVDQLTLSHGGNTYTFTLDNAITINNPLIPPYVDYKDISSIEDSYTGTTPSRVYSEDGETITVTLPTIASWTEDMRSDVASGAQLTGSTTAKQYTSSWPYTKYTVVTNTYTATVTTTRWTNTMEIVGWKIGNTVYKPGETVTLTGNQTIIAVVQITEGAKTTTTATQTGTEVIVTNEGTVYTRPSGYTSVSTAPTGTDGIVWD